MTEELLETLFRLHERRWSASGRATSFDRSRAGLHRRLIARAGPGRGPAMVLAEQDGQAVGALYGFCWEEVFAYYQTGWEPEWADANLGTVLVAEAIRLAGLAGARVFDFLRGAEAYKYRSAPPTGSTGPGWSPPAWAAGSSTSGTAWPSDPPGPGRRRRASGRSRGRR